jgi:hypothetical protein
MKLLFIHIINAEPLGHGADTHPVFFGHLGEGRFAFTKPSNKGDCFDINKYYLLYPERLIKRKMTASE